MKHRSKRLLDRARDAIRLKGYSVRTEEAYADRRMSPIADSLPSWRDPAHPTGHDRCRHIFRDHWHTWCDLRLADEVPPDQRAYVRKTAERMILCRDPNGDYVLYICPGCKYEQRVPFSCKNRRPYTVDLQSVDGLPEYSLLVDHRSYEAHPGPLATAGTALLQRKRDPAR